MKITLPNDRLKIIRQDDSDFSMSVGMYAYPRAGFEIDKSCPENTIIFLFECLRAGWIKPVAYMKESEYVWEKLAE
jgi:hypothetical protein